MTLRWRRAMLALMGNHQGRHYRRRHQNSGHDKQH
jgi:hypothetical protein